MAARQFVSDGTSVDVPVQDLPKLLASSRGAVIVAPRLTAAELRWFVLRDDAVRVAPQAG